MNADLKRATDFLRKLGIENIPHSDKNYLAHLVAVHRDLERWGCPSDVCLGGMFHSIYGTEMFQGFKLPVERRAELRDLIGVRAEYLGYLNCAMDRPSFDAIFTKGDSAQRENPPDGKFKFGDRLTRETVELSRQDFDDLCRIHLCDWLEQVPRSKKWDYRRDAYRGMAAWLGGVAQEAYDRVFASAAAPA
jgi:hypothetical protein